jgi:hypothetical protein
MAGINRALLENHSMAKTAALLNRPCIFLSHIAVDRSAAINIGEYIRNKGDIDIYLDIHDQNLQTAANDGDAAAITRFIEKGLLSSTHIMCLATADTARSWWVPYELGFAKNAGAHLATLKFKDVVLPAYLEISEIIHGTGSLNAYLTRVKFSLGKMATRSLTETLIKASAMPHPLDLYLDWQG